MIENNQTIEEVVEALKLVETDYKTVEEKHVELVEKVEEFARIRKGRKMDRRLP